MHLFLRAIKSAETSRDLARSRKASLVFELILSLCLFVGLSVFVFGQNSAPNAPPPALDASGIMPFLDQTLTWYRQMSVVQQIANDPSEVTIVTDNRQLANQIVRLSFDFARAEADAITSSQRSTPVQAQTGGTAEQQAMVKAEDQVDQEIKNAEIGIEFVETEACDGHGQAAVAFGIPDRTNPERDRASKDTQGCYPQHARVCCRRRR